MADEPTNKGLTSEQAESNRLAAQGNEYGKQEVDLANKSFALQRLGISDTVQKLQEVNESVQDNQQTTMERFTDGYKKMVESLYEQGRVFNNVGGAIKQDFGKLGLAFAPLTSIPGVETAITLVKSILAKLFIFLIAKDKRDAALAKLRAMKDRAKEIGGKVGAQIDKIPVLKQIKAGYTGLFLGLTTAAGVFVKGFISGFQLQLSKILQFLNFKKLGLSLQIKSLKNWSKMTTSIFVFGKRLENILKPLKTIGPVLQKVIKPLQNVLRFIGRFGTILGRIFVPIQIIIGMYEAITGFMDGFKKYEGQGFVTQMFAGISQGIGDLAGFLIGWPLDFLKSVVAGIGSFFGFDTSMLEDFSFQDMFSNLGTFIGDWIAGFIDGIKTSIADIGIGGLLKNITLSMIKIFKKIAMFPAAVASGAVLGLAAAWPGGETPGEAFMRGFNGVFNAGDAAIDSFRTEADGLDQEGNVIEQQSEATADAKTNTNAESNTNNAVVNTTVNNTAGKKVVTTRANQPADDFGYRLAYS